MRKFREILAGGDKGFTLIELLVVIAVLGILAGIAIPRISGVRDEAVRSTLRADAATLRNAMEMAFAIDGDYPAVSADSTTNLSALTISLDNGEDIFSFSPDSTNKVQSGTSGGASYSIDLRDENDKFTLTVSSANGIGTVNDVTGE